MIEKRNVRIERERMPPPPGGAEKVSEQELFAKSKNLIKVVKRGD